MVSILKNTFSGLKWKINKNIDNTKQSISNIVLAILITTWVWVSTKAQANTESFQQFSTHKVIKWDGLLKISKKYWLTINELIELNKWRNYWNHKLIWKNNTIYLWTELIISKKNKVLHAKKVNTLNVLDNKKKNKTQIDKVTIKEKKLDHVLKYSAMYEKQWDKYKKHYTISPSDTPFFTWKIKKISWKVYVEVRLANDKDITWFVKLAVFNENSKNIIKNSIKNEKNEVMENTSIKKNQILTDKEKTKNWITKALNNTLIYASNNRNPICIKNDKYINYLSEKLSRTESLINRLNNEDNARILLIHKINVLSIWLNVKSNIDFDNINIDKLFDYYATLERLRVSKQYFSNIWFEKLYINHIKKDFWWNWALALKTISKKLLLKRSIIKYNTEIPKKLIALRKKWIENLLNTISKAENTNNNYNAIFSNGKQHKIQYTKMTIKEVLIDMKKRIKTKWSSATGKYQFMYLTLKNLTKKYNIDINNQLFSPEFQEKIARIKLKERWLEKFLKWDLKRDAFQINISAEWASLAKDESWKSYHHKDWINKAFCSNEKIDMVLDSIKNPKPETKTLVASL